MASAGELDLAEVYRRIHEHPELSFTEEATAALVADDLARSGWTVLTGVGRTGVVGVWENGPGPVVCLRADMDALPVLEETGLPYASRVEQPGPDGAPTPVAHVCGHDMHTTCLLGACRALASRRDRWTGTVVAVFQPAEELGAGARAMVEDGLFERVPAPEVVLGQHVAPLPAGLVGLGAGVAFAASDSLRITLHGRGGHGSRPETTVDPVVLAAATVLRLQTVVSREVAGTETAVVTVGSMTAGTKNNIIPDSAELALSVRTFDPDVRARVLAAIERIAKGEALAAGAEREPEVVLVNSFPTVVNTEAATARVAAAFETGLGPGRVVAPGPVTGSEDVGLLATACGAACVYWLLGGADPAAFAQARTVDEIAAVVRGLPSNHSPQYAPVIEPTLGTGVQALVAAAEAWLAPAGTS